MSREDLEWIVKQAEMQSSFEEPELSFDEQCDLLESIEEAGVCL